MEQNNTELTLVKLTHKEIQFLLKHREKRILDLISIGQAYLDEDYVEAKFDMFATMIKSCVQIVLDQAYYDSRNIDISNASGRWIIPVLAAGTLQVDNSLFYLVRERLKREGIDPENEKNKEKIVAIKKEIEQEQKAIWREKAESHRAMCKPHFAKLISAGRAVIDGKEQQVITVLPYCITWDELLNGEVQIQIEKNRELIPQQQPAEQFSFKKTYQDLLKEYYKQHKLSQAPNSQVNSYKLFIDVNEKGYDYIRRNKERFRRFLQAMTNTERLQHHGLTTALHKDGSLKDESDINYDKLTFDLKVPLFEENLKYVLIEFAFMTDDLTKGCCLPNDFDQQSPTIITYPGGVEKAFGTIKETVAQSRKGQNVKCSDIHWLAFSKHSNASLAELEEGVSDMNSGIQFTGFNRTKHEKLLINKILYKNPYRNLVIRKESCKMRHPEFDPAALFRGEFQVYNLPSEDQHFVQRKEIEEKLNLHFHERPDSNTQTKKVVLGCLQGLGGMGKTVSALRFCFQHIKIYKSTPNKSLYTMIFWINATDQKEINRELKQFAVDLDLVKADTKLPIALEALHQYLEDNPGWLSVFDDLHEEILKKELEIKPSVDKLNTSNQKARLWLPRSGGHVLATSRIEGLDPKDIIIIDTMQPTESIALLSKILATRFSDQALGRLANELGHYPLAMTLAAAYIAAEPNLSIDEFIGEYRKSADILDKDRRNIAQENNQKKNPAYHQKTVHATLTMILYKLSPPKQKPSVARELLSVMAFLDGVGIPSELLFAWLINRYNTKSKDILFNALDLLQKYYLTRKIANNLFNMHSVIQDILRKWSAQQIKQSYQDLGYQNMVQKWHGNISSAFSQSHIVLVLQGDANLRDLFRSNAMRYMRSAVPYCFNQSEDFLLFLEFIAKSEALYHNHSLDSVVASLLELYLMERYYPNHERIASCRSFVSKIISGLISTDKDTHINWMLSTDLPDSDFPSVPYADLPENSPIERDPISLEAKIRMLGTNSKIDGLAELATRGTIPKANVYVAAMEQNAEILQTLKSALAQISNRQLHSIIMTPLIDRMLLNILHGELIEVQFGNFTKGINRFWNLLEYIAKYSHDSNFLMGIWFYGFTYKKHVDHGLSTNKICHLLEMTTHYFQKEIHRYHAAGKIFDLYMMYGHCLTHAGDFSQAITIYTKAKEFYIKGSHHDINGLEECIRKLSRSNDKLAKRTPLTIDDETRKAVDKIFSIRERTLREPYNGEQAYQDILKLHRDFCHTYSNYTTQDTAKAINKTPVSCGEMVSVINEPEMNDFFYEVILCQYQKPGTVMTIKQIILEVIKDGNLSALQILSHLAQQQNDSLPKQHSTLLHYYIGFLSPHRLNNLPKARQDNYYDCLKLLLKAGYNPSTTNDAGITAFELAQGKEKILNLLKSYNTDEKHQLNKSQTTSTM